MREDNFDIERVGGVFPIEDRWQSDPEPSKVSWGPRGQGRRGALYSHTDSGSAMPLHFQPSHVVDGKYKVEKELGRGGMGAVVQVLCVQTKMVHALKYCTETEDIFLKRFAREVRITRRIKHPNVVPILDANLEHDPPYFVMPLAENSLQEELGDLSRDESKALDAFEEVCLGIQAIHNSNGVHRDIKPLNALRMSDGKVAVSDLGLAKLDPRDTTALTQTNMAIGTRIYCAPEQLMPGGSREADHRTDIFQLGKLLYELLTANSPALIDMNALPSGLAYIIQRAVRDDPANRYQSLGELMDALKYYRLSKDPKQNPREAFENLLQSAEELLKNNQYRAETLKEMLALLGNGVKLSAGTLIEMFGRVPKLLLKVMVEQLSDELLPVLVRYIEALKIEVSSYTFEYAEKVASRMQLVFETAKDHEVKKYAILACLIAAVDLHRYAAMDVFDGMLRKVQSPGDAFAIAEMLRENASYYKVLADRIPADALHPVIRVARKDVLGEES